MNLNACRLVILRVVASLLEGRDAQNERDEAAAAQLRRSSNSVAASTQMVVSSSRPSSRCCQQLLHLHAQEGRELLLPLRRSSISCSSIAAAAGDGSVPRR